MTIVTIKFENEFNQPVTNNNANNKTIAKTPSQREKDAANPEMTKGQMALLLPRLQRQKSRCG